jgi:hypothetical protein
MPLISGRTKETVMLYKNIKSIKNPFKNKNYAIADKNFISFILIFNFIQKVG